MLRAFGWIQRTMITVVFLALALTNALLWHEPILGGILLVSYAVFGSLSLGRALLPEKPIAHRFWFGLYFLASASMLVGSVFYYAWSLPPNAATVLLTASAPLLLWCSLKRIPASTAELADRERPSIVAYAALALSIFAVILLFATVLAHPITTPVRSLWLVVPPAVFIAFALALFPLGSLLQRGENRSLTIPLFASALFAFLSVATLAFPLGYGFDPFIHRATEAHIAEFGTITPKPFYYIGQYALVVLLHNGFSLPIDLLDAWLVPVLTVLLLPLAWFTAATHLTKDKRAAAATLLALFLIPLGSFISTTPQGLANLWILLLLLAAVPALVTSSRPRPWWLVLPALATLAIHPLSGLPAIVFVGLLLFNPLHQSGGRAILSRVLFWIIALLGCAALPASFAVNALRNGAAGLDLSALTPSAILASFHFDLFLQNRFNPILDFVYLYGFNAVLLVVVFAIVSAWHFRKTQTKSLIVFLILVVILVANYAILSTAVDFSFLISYEREDFAARLITLMTFALSPFLILGAGHASMRLRTAPMAVRASALVLLTAVATASFYLAYPRHDAYVTGHGFNVGASDLAAVRAIDSDANGGSYIVLANQSVSAAALQELGFAHYFGQAFFYPIPTGAPLYAEFLAMNEHPNRDIAETAATIANDACTADAACTQQPVEAVYWAVNDYWWQSERLIETGKQTADRWFAIDDGALTIFRYDVTE